MCQTDTQKLEEDSAVDLILGNNQKKQIVEALEEYEKEHTKKVKVIEINKTKEYEDLSIGYTAEHAGPISRCRTDATSSVRIASSLMRKAVFAAERLLKCWTRYVQLAARGYKEVVLTGIHLSSYGVDFKEEERESLSVTDPGRA